MEGLKILVKMFKINLPFFAGSGRHGVILAHNSVVNRAEVVRQCYRYGERFWCSNYSPYFPLRGGR
jgi:hypothetical protein